MYAFAPEKSHELFASPSSELFAKASFLDVPKKREVCGGREEDFAGE
jgi:hypothetical protein